MSWLVLVGVPNKNTNTVDCAANPVHKSPSTHVEGIYPRLSYSGFAADQVRSTLEPGRGMRPQHSTLGPKSGHVQGLGGLTTVLERPGSGHLETPM